MDKPPDDYSLLAQIMTALTAILSGFWAYINRNAKAARVSLDKMETRINAISREMTETKTITNETKSRVERMENKLDRVIEKGNEFK